MTFGLCALLSYQHQYVACGCSGPGGELSAVSPALSTIWESPLTGYSTHSGCCPQFDRTVPELFFSVAGACKTDLLAGRRRCEVLELVSEERLSGEARSNGNLRK